MIDDFYVYARLSDLARQCAQIVAERKRQAALAAPAPDAAPGERVARGPLCEPAAPLARA